MTWVVAIRELLIWASLPCVRCKTALIALPCDWCAAVLEAVLSSSGRCPIVVSSLTRQGSVVERQLNESWRTIRVSGLAKADGSIMLFRASVL